MSVVFFSGLTYTFFIKIIDDHIESIRDKISNNAVSFYGGSIVKNRHCIPENRIPSVRMKNQKGELPDATHIAWKIAGNAFAQISPDDIGWQY